MVPIPQSALQRPRRDVFSHDGSSSPLFHRKVQRPPRITYGRRDTRLLSLKANQFRPDIYAIPLDDDEADFNARQDGARALLHATGHDAPSDDSGLSGAELLPKNRLLNTKKAIAAHQLKQAEVNAGVPHPSLTSVAGTAHSKKGTAKPVRTPESKPVYPPESRRQAKVKISKRSRIGNEITASISKRRAPTTRRRLPVNELFLVKSPLHLDHNVDSDEFFSRFPAEDPIDDASSSLYKRRSSTRSERDEEIRDERPEVSLDSVRKRFKPPKYGIESLRRSRGETANNVFTDTGTESRGRDGFEDSELSIRPHFKITKRRHKQKERLLFGFGCLELVDGPLPDVKFESLTMELEMEPCHDNASLGFTEQQNDESAAELPSASRRRRVSFSNRERDDLIRAQLSSVSAAARVPSDSDDSYDDEDEEVEDEDGVTEGANERSTDSVLLGENNRAVGQSSAKIFDYRTNRHLDPNSPEQPIEKQTKVNTGVTLDYRQPFVPGQLTATICREAQSHRSPGSNY